MNTNSRLFNLGIRDDANCYLCGSDVEDLDHLFFNCHYSQKVVDLIKEWSALNIPYNDILRWRLSWNGEKEDKEVINAIVNACMYHIWHQRNTSRVELRLLRPESLLSRITSELGTRFLAVTRRPEDRRGRLLMRLLGDQDDDEDGS
ncbi:hypothetical protein RND81_11G061000 [Saponaria officinalis]|uniref:Reverse transcriptase zinc-binding domain-containing protein n=1 Tax=Saponaria officinalis TaxID=3572 RepID=A0AAW1HHG5_SAPOF